VLETVGRLRRRAAAAVAPAVHHGLLLLARDASQVVAAGKLLVVAPHPDDETIACGALLAASAARGLRPVVVCVTDGRYGLEGADPDRCAEIRRSELAASAEILGIAPGDVVMLGYEDSTVSAHVDQLTEDLCKLVREIEPRVLATSSLCDLHADHAAVAQAARRACRGSGIRLLEYVVWGWQHPFSWMARPGCLRRLGRPVKVSASSKNATKLEALACYRSQAEPGGPLGPGFSSFFLQPHELFFEPAETPRRWCATRR
jgi:LmbE family N-acetylglucosaminyl deacetylase